MGRSDTTFLFTDIVASTELWERHSEHMAATMDRHDDLTESVIGRHRGRVVDHAGDGVFAVFDDPVDAVLSSVDLQLRLADEPWPHRGELQVRVGVHTGVAIRRGEKYTGPEVHRAARIMQQAAARQILISEATRSRSHERLDRLVGFSEVGTVALRGLRHAERIFEVRHPDLSTEAALTLPRTSTTPKPGLLERDSQLDHLRRAWHSARAGSGSVVVVAGEPGVGKSSLVRALCAEVRSDRLLFGACDDLSTPRAFGAIRDLALDADGPLERISFTDRDEVFEALLDEVRRRPTLVVIEDVQWADDATLDAVRLLARRIDRLPTLLVLTTRPVRRGLASVFQAIAGASASSTLTVEPLSRDAVSQLAAESPLDADEIYRMTGGNPLFVSELVTSGRTDLPVSVRESVLARLRALTPEVRSALEGLAVIPGAVDHWLVELVVEDWTVLEDAESAGVLVAEGSTVRFRHELIRRLIEDTMPAERRRRIHGRVAEILSAADAEHASVAHHAFAAQREDLVRRHVPPAVEEAMVTGGHRQALSLLTRFEPYLDDSESSLRGWIERQRAAAHYALDDGQQALVAARRAVDLAASGDADPALAEALTLMGQISWWLRDMRAAADAATAGLQVVDRLEPDPGVAKTLADLARLLALAGDPRAEETAERALAMADAVGSKRAHARAKMALATSGAFDDFVDRTLEAMEEAEAAGDATARLLATTNLSTALVVGHRYEEAARWLPRARELSERLEHSVAFSVCTGMAAWHRAMTGDLHGALEDFLEYDDLVEEDNQRAWGWVHRAVVLARLGQTDEALELVGRGSGRRIGRALDPRLVFEAAAVEVRWLAGVEFDGVAVRDEVLKENLDVMIRDYLARLACGLQRVGVDVPPPTIGLAAYDLALAGRHHEAGEAWRVLGNPYEAGVELALAGEPEGSDLLEQVGALGTLRRLGL